MLIQEAVLRWLACLAGIPTVVRRRGGGAPPKLKTDHLVWAVATSFDQLDSSPFFKVLFVDVEMYEV
jgi:hypothetical protein